MWLVYNDNFFLFLFLWWELDGPPRPAPLLLR
jgi:hypothetical protein